MPRCAVAQPWASLPVNGWFYARADNLSDTCGWRPRAWAALCQAPFRQRGPVALDTDLAGDPTADGRPGAGARVVKTPGQIDDVFYESRGYLGTAAAQLRDIEVDFGPVLRDREYW